MTALAAALCAAGAVLAGAHRHARPDRLRSAPTPGRSIAAVTVLEAVGRRARGVLGRRPAAAADRAVGAGIVLAVGAVAFGPQPAALGAAAALLHTRWRRVRTRPGASSPGVERDLPDLVDLLALAVGAGVSVPGALPLVAPVAPGVLRADLEAATEAIAGGRDADDAILELGRRWGTPARPLVHALTDHLRYGTPALPALERVALEGRAARRRAAETRARKLPVLLLFPLVLCTLPAFGLLTVAPLVAGTFDALSGGHLEAPASTGP